MYELKKEEKMIREDLKDTRKEIRERAKKIMEAQSKIDALEQAIEEAARTAALDEQSRLEDEERIRLQN